MSDVTPDDRDLAIRTMLGEEGSEEGQAGVAAVILNRLAAGSYGASIGDVVLARNQFEAWTRQSDQLLGIRRDSPRYVLAGQLFDAVRDGSLPDPTNGATHFYAPVAQAALGRQAPGWSQGQGLRLGSSMFYAPQGRVERKPDAPQGRVERKPDAPRTYLDFAEGLKRLDAQRQSGEMERPAQSLSAGAKPVQAAPQVPNRPPAFLKDAQPVAPQVSKPAPPNRPPAFLKDAQPVAPQVPKDAQPVAPARIAEGADEFSDPITAEAYRKAHEPLRPPLPGAFMGPPGESLGGVVLDPSLPIGVRGLAAASQEGLNALRAPFETTQQQAQRIRQGGSLTPQDAGSVAMNAGLLGAREAPGGIMATRGAALDLGAPLSVEAPVPPRPVPSVATPPVPPRPTVEPPPVVKPVVAPVAKPVEPPPVVKPTAPVEPPPVVKPTVAPKTSSRIDQPTAQALIDDLRKKFGVEKPVPVTVSNRGEPGTSGALNTKWAGALETKLKKFRRTGVVDPAMGTPHSYEITVRSDAGDRALSVGTLLHEFGHVLQNDKFISAPAETRAAILAAFHRETQAFGKLSPEEFPAVALDPVKNAIVKDFETRTNDTISTSHQQEYNQRFNEWFANQVSTWFTSTREATTLVDKFFKGIADAWKAIYQRVAGRQGAAPEIDAFMRGMWDEGKAVEETPRAAGGEVPVTIQFRGKTYSGATKLDAVGAARRATGISMDRIWDETTPEHPAAALPKDIPTTVYRGTGRADPHSAYNQGLGPQSIPIAGPGRYYAFNKSDAQEFGPTVVSVEMPVQNPLVIRDGNAWRELTRKAGWQTPNPFGASEAQMREMTQRLQKIVRGMGHDGIVAYWDDSSPYDIGPKGENLKLLRNTFGMPQVVAFATNEAHSVKARAMIQPRGGPLEGPDRRLPF